MLPDVVALRRALFDLSRQAGIDLGELALSDDAARGLGDDKEDTRDPAVIIPQGAVAVREEGFLGPTVPVRGIARVLDKERLTGEHLIEDGGELVP